MAFRPVIPIRSVSYAPHQAEGMTRRDFMKWMAASVALGSAACSGPPQERIYPYVNMPEGIVPGDPIYYATQWVRDGYAQGILVSTQMGRPVKVEGNPNHPANFGGTDIFAQASVLQLWDPDRSQSVMQGGARLSDKLSASPSTWSAFEAAWRERAQQFAPRKGEGLRILTGPLTSPTTLDALQRLLRRYPAARWHRHAPIEGGGSNALRIGDVPIQPIWHFDRAEVIVAFDCDPFSMSPAHLRHARDWSTSRKAGRPLRLFAIESQPGALGAVAQQRIALAPSETEALLGRVASRVAAGLGQLADRRAAKIGVADTTAQFEDLLVKALLDSPGRSLLMAGAHLSPDAQQRVHWLNHRLGNIGKTMDYIETPDASIRFARPLAELLEDMRTGHVDSLVILGGNPVYDTPGEAEFAAALARVPFSLHLSLYEDETSLLSTWHLPETHAMEGWGDVRAFDGTAGIVQPAIAPLYDTRSALEVLALLDDDTLRSGHDLVQRFWRQRIGEQRFDDFWNASLRQGFITDSSMAVIHGEEPPAPQTPAIVPPSSADSLTAIFAEDAAVADGSFANIGWLQELPRSASKLTWDNAVLIGPKTAENLQLRDGSVVRLARGNRALEAPVLVMPTHAENCITLPLGYGRRNAGRVGNGVGFDAYSLRPLTGSVAQVRLTRTGRQYDFAITQHETSMHGRDIVRTVAARNAAAAQHKQQPSLYPQPQSPVHAWAMNIDLDACIGCNACTIACQAENNIPVVGKEEVKRGRVMHWIRVDRYIERRNARDLMLFQPVPCMHCEDAPCEAVCPVGATVHDSEGLNVQVYNRCVGTRFCSNNCPYKVRRFNFLAYANTEVESLKALQNPDVTVRRRGVMEKCSYCVQRISRARINAERSGTPLVDGDVVTACEAACPTQAIVFGDLRDANSRVSSARKSSRHYVLLEELNTRPRTTYLARVLDSDDGEVS